MQELCEKNFMSSKDVSLRPFSEDDLEQILRVEQGSHPNPWTREHFEAELAKPYSRILVLTDDETDTEILGYIVFWVLMRDCQILNVVVDLKYRGKGYAQMMLRKALSIAMKDDAKRAILDVRKSNLPAIQLYQKVGFLTNRIQKGFYSNGEDAYQMILEFEGMTFDL